MTIALWPAVGATVLDHNGDEITTAGIIVSEFSDYYRQLVVKARLLTYDPIDGGDPAVEIEPRTSYRYIAADGTPLPRRDTVDFVGGAAEDDAENNTTRVQAGAAVGVLASTLVAPAASAAPAFLRGNAAALDGAEGLAYYDPTSVVTADNIEYFGTGTGRHKRVIDGEINFKWFCGLYGGDGGGVTDCTAAWAAAIAYCSTRSKGLFIPPGKWRITAGATVSVNYRDVFIRGVGRVCTHSAGNIHGSMVFLDSTDAATFFLHCSNINTVKITGVMFHATDVTDRVGIRLSGNNAHTFEDCGFLSVNRPVVYSDNSYHQNGYFKNVIWNNSGTIHSEAVYAGVGVSRSLVCTLLRIDNCNHENGVIANSDKVLMNLTGVRQIVSHNLLLEGSLPSANEWTALKLNNFYEAGYVRSPFAIFTTYHCEFSGVNTLKYSVDQVGGCATFEQLAGFGSAAAPKYKLSSSGRAIIKGSAFAGTNENPTDFFELADNSCTVELQDCGTRHPYRDAANFTHRNTMYLESGVDPTVVSNDAAQEVWRWKGGYVAAEGAALSLAGSSTAAPSTDATYGRKIVGTPVSNTLGVAIQVNTKAAIGSGDQVIVMVRCKLPTFSGGNAAVNLLVDDVVKTSSGRTPSESGTIINVTLAFRLGAAAARFGISITQGGATACTGTLEIYSLAFYHGERIPRRQMPVYPVNVITYGTAAPTTGTWATGDRVLNSSPSVGNPKGWVCTVAGTPGTWVSEGNL